MKQIIIAIDGYAATGKSTTAKQVANALDYTFIDTGAMYRAVTLYFLRNHIDFTSETPELRKALAEIDLEFRPNPETGLRDMWMNGENVAQEIRSMDVSAVVSEVSTIGVVRKRLVALQREMAREGGIVMDGRDIGTVVFPDADLKVFLTANMDIRVKRRMMEEQRKGKTVTPEQVRQNLIHRDHIDSTRANSPLKKADDAIGIDTSGLTIPQQVEMVVEMARERIRNGTPA